MTLGILYFHLLPLTPLCDRFLLLIDLIHIYILGIQLRTYSINGVQYTFGE